MPIGLVTVSIEGAHFHQRTFNKAHHRCSPLGRFNDRDGEIPVNVVIAVMSSNGGCRYAVVSARSGPWRSDGGWRASPIKA